MFPHQDPNLPVEERLDDLLLRMTTEEKIMQTDQYFSGDFTTQDENGKVVAMDMQRFAELMHGNSVGSVQLRGMTAAQANTVQRYAVENTRLGFRSCSAKKPCTVCSQTMPPAFPSRSVLPPPLNLLLVVRWDTLSPRKREPAGFMRPIARLWI